MNVPRKQRIFCKKCGKHTEHTLELAKKKQKRKMSLGQRRFDKKMKGYGSFPKPMPSGKKPTQRQDMRYRCDDCKLAITRQKSYRVKKFEMTE